MGQSQQKVSNRWLVVVGAVLIQLCLGAIYAWSVFTPYLTGKLQDPVTKFGSAILSMDTKFQSELDNNTISPDLRQEINSKGFSLSEKAKVNLLETRKKWQVVDEKNTLNIKLENDQLEVSTDLPETKTQIDTKFQSELDNNTISPDLKQEINSKGFSLSEKAKVNLLETGKKWQVVDEKNTLNIKLENNQLKLWTGFSKTQTQIVFAVGLAVFALVMIFAGKWQAKTGPRKVAITGGILLGAGYILAGFLGNSLATQIIFIGLLGGAGIGFAYVCPIAVGMKWFPDKKGLITGLAVAGFGFGALIWIKLADNWGHLLENFGVLRVFLIYGIVFAAAVLIGSIWMKNPPEGWKPAGWNPPEPKKGKKASSGDLMPSQVLRTPQFYSLWIMFIFSGMAGLMTIGIIKLFGIDALQNRGGFDATQASIIAGTAMAVFYSLANGIGRIVWGTVSDKIGRKISLFIMCLTQGIMMLLFYKMGANQYLLYLGATIIGFNFGGNFALFPTATADFFGSKNVGMNYPWVFTAYGIGGIIGPIMAGIIGSRGSWLPAFIICGVACLVAAFIALTLKSPKSVEA